MQEEINRNTALCYVRQSTTGGGGEESLDHQRLNVEQVCGQHGWEPEWYEDVDDPTLGTTAADRLSWAALQVRLGDADVAALVVDDLTRLHRNPDELDALIQTLEEYGIQLVTAESMEISL